ncbi:MAG TPA: biotin-dependent carboxyltransferase family protein [Candidatus Choladousia intestinigallinarum]|nr:biotin-dependent carboxyltransferase family protein [Candidatus Choladousia intestinigallinarum]
MCIKVLIPGAFTTVQDLGRMGYQQSGIPCGGVMDREAYTAANALAGNTAGEAVLEHTLFGGSYLFESDETAVLTGADMKPSLNGRPVPMYHPFSVKAGEILSLGTAVNGCRTYLSLAGGIDVPLVLGSRSTSIKCCLGGFQGRALRAGDQIPVGRSDVPASELLSRSAACPVYKNHVTVRVIGGPQEDFFTDKGLETFYSSSYTITPESDRMGYRLEGAKIESIGGTDIISDAIVFGSIQIPPSGKPIILLADRQTTGGYAKIAAVFSLDLPPLVQCRCGDTVRFSRISVEQAQELLNKKGDSYGSILYEP